MLPFYACHLLYHTQVTKQKKWADIGRLLGYTGIPGLSTQIKNSYTRVILPYEHFCERVKNSPALASLLHSREREREGVGAGEGLGVGGAGVADKGHAHVNAPSSLASAVGVGLGINGSGSANGSVMKEEKMQVDVDTEFAKADTTTNASTAPDSPLTETSSILSELPDGEGEDEEGGGGRGGKNGEGNGEGEVVLKAGRPRRAVRDGTGEFSVFTLVPTIRSGAGLVEV